MEYEYKAISLVTGDSTLNDHEAKILNDFFQKGWEYVHGFSQAVSSSGGTFSSNRAGSVLIILRKKKDNLTV